MTGRQQGPPIGAENRLIKLEVAIFSPAANRLVTVGNGWRLSPPNLDNGRHYERYLDIESAPIWAVAFSPSGQFLAIGSGDGTARLWFLTPQGPVDRLTLLGLPQVWATLVPDGRYKRESDVGGQFWHVIGICRFEIGELDSSLPDVRQLPLTPPSEAAGPGRPAIARTDQGTCAGHASSSRVLRRHQSGTRSGGVVA